MQLGAKDIRKDLRKKRHLDRLENATNELDDEVSFATFLAQGEHELKLEHSIQNVFFYCSVRNLSLSEPVVKFPGTCCQVPMYREKPLSGNNLI